MEQNFTAILREGRASAFNSNTSVFNTYHTNASAIFSASTVLKDLICSFNLQGNASSFKHSQQFLRKNCFRKVKHYMQHILSSSISSYISLGIKCISPMTTAYHPCLIQLVHSTLFIHMNIFAKFRFYALPSSRIMVHELQYSNIYYSPVYLCSYCSTTIVIIPK